MSRWPVPWLGSATIGQMRQAMHHRDGAEIEEVAGGGIEAADAALAEDHLELPSARMYSADSRSSWIVADSPRFSSTGFPARPARLSRE